MKLMSIKTFQDKYFEKSDAPTTATVKKWIEDGTITGRKIGGKYFINVNAFELTGNKLVDDVLLAS